MNIKYCGLKTSEDYFMAWSLGIDYVGFVCYSQSPRAITSRQARNIIDEVHNNTARFGETPSHAPPRTVGLYVDTSWEGIASEMEYAQFDILQLYGWKEYTHIDRPHWRAYRIKSADELRDIQEAYQGTRRHEDMLQGIVIDVKHDIMYGGSGTSFDWRWLDRFDISLPYFVAGGIEQENVRDLLAYNPYGIDVSSGIERIRGTKDHTLMRDLAETIRSYREET